MGCSDSLALVDLDGDGDLDLAASGVGAAVLMNDGAGTFGPKAVITSAQGLDNMAAADT